MGKGKGQQKGQKQKNVFKVATVRSVKLKAKAQKVVSNLKKLDVKGNKEKMAEIDKQLQEIRKEAGKPKAGKSIVKPAKLNLSQAKKQQKTANKPPVQTDKATSLVEQMQI